MWRFAGRKLVSLVAILPVITLLVFLMRVLVPGDPVEVMFMGQATDRATIERIHEQVPGAPVLSKPVTQQRLQEAVTALL